jgi:hypothetical protein
MGKVVHFQDYISKYEDLASKGSDKHSRLCNKLYEWLSNNKGGKKRWLHL